MYAAEIRISGEKAFLKACAASLEPEAQFSTYRASYQIKLNSDLKIKIEAKDAIAFRATVNSLSGLLATAEQAWKAEEHKKAKE